MLIGFEDSKDNRKIYWTRLSEVTLVVDEANETLVVLKNGRCFGTTMKAADIVRTIQMNEDIEVN